MAITKSSPPNIIPLHPPLTIRRGVVGLPMRVEDGEEEGAEHIYRCRTKLKSTMKKRGRIGGYHHLVNKTMLINTETGGPSGRCFNSRHSILGLVQASKLRPDAAGDQARDRWIFIIMAPAGLAAIQPDSLHFAA